MSKEDVKFNKERITFSKKIKRQVLMEIIKGKKPNEALQKYLDVPLDEITNDKKYAAKLIHKWKKEAFTNREMLFLLNHDIDNDLLDAEIEMMSKDDDKEIDLATALNEIGDKFFKYSKAKR